MQSAVVHKHHDFHEQRQKLLNQKLVQGRRDQGESFERERAKLAE